MVIENMIQKVFEYPEGSTEREQLILLVANHMKKSYISWNKEGVDDAKIFQDLAEYTKGKLTIAPGSIKLFEIKDNQPRIKPKLNNNNMKKQGKN
jgi:hypothetical protein